MSYRHRFEAAAVFVFLAQPLVSQTFDISRLRTGVDSMSIHMIQGLDTTAVGTLWDEWTILPAPNDTIGRRVYRWNNQILGPSLDTVFLRLPTLRPISRRTYAQLGSDSLRYRGDSVLGWVVDYQGETRRIRRLFPEIALDPSAVDLIIRAASLAANWEWDAQVYLASQDSMIRISARVAGTEQVSQRDGAKVNCWRVEVDYPPLSFTMWIDPLTRHIVQEIMHLTPEVAMLMVRYN